MLLVLDDTHKEHLKLLSEVSFDVVREFCRLSLEFIKKGTNPKVYQGAAQKLDVPIASVHNCVEAMIYLFTECTKLMINELDFQDSIMTLMFPETVVKELLQNYLENRKEIRSILTHLTPDFPHYHNLEWRLDVKLASRCLRQETDPLIILKLHLDYGGKKEIKVLQTDPVNLLHLTQELESALQEVKAQHARRIMRNIK